MTHHRLVPCPLVAPVALVALFALGSCAPPPVFDEGRGEGEGEEGEGEEGEGEEGEGEEGEGEGDVGEGEGEGVPAGWRCDPAFFDADDGCDCGCGVVDGDCVDASFASCAFSSCAEGTVVDVDDTTRCVSEPAEPAACDRDDDCAAGAICQRLDGLCVEPPPVAPLPASDGTVVLDNFSVIAVGPDHLSFHFRIASDAPVFSVDSVFVVDGAGHLAHSDTHRCEGLPPWTDVFASPQSMEVEMQLAGITADGKAMVKVPCGQTVNFADIDYLGLDVGDAVGFSVRGFLDDGRLFHADGFGVVQ